jgi:hypothetical protein
MMTKIFNAIVLVAAISTLAITAAAQTAPAELQPGMRMMDMSAMQNCPMAFLAFLFPSTIPPTESPSNSPRRRVMSLNFSAGLKASRRCTAIRKTAP